MSYRNIAIIAHVDHGKTTLVDGLLRQCDTFEAHEKVVDRVMDSMDLERERGITITSKNTAVTYQGTKINIVDTPGHSDFGGEVERVLQMVEGALLLVDASEGPLPQTRFVLRKALEAGLVIVVCINKVDRPDARTPEVLQEIYDLFIDLDADDALLEFPVVYASAKQGVAGMEENDLHDNLRPLLDVILDAVPAPDTGNTGNPTLLVTNLDYDSYVGRLGLGRLFGGELRKGQSVTWFGEEKTKKVKIQQLYTWDGLKRKEVPIATAGDIVAVAGIANLGVGDSIVSGEDPKPLPRIHVDEPTIAMTFSINTSPLAGLEGSLVTGRQIRERLERELLSNVSLRMEAGTGSSESFRVLGRGELQLAILVEQMRREGFELTISQPEVIKKIVNDQLLEPWERIIVEVPDTYIGAVTQGMAHRKGELQDMQSNGSGRTHMVYRIPSRGLIGFRSELLTESRGEGTIHTEFAGWEKDAGPLKRRANGALVADRAGTTTGYALFHLQPRGTLFVGPQIGIYEGMILGEHCRENDLNINGTKGKQLTNFRASGTDDKLVLTPAKQVTLEWAIEFIDQDEWVEITPKSIRLRKKTLAANQRSIVRTQPTS